MAVMPRAERVVETEVKLKRVVLEAAEKRMGVEAQRIELMMDALCVSRQRIEAGIFAGLEAVEAETVLSRARTSAESRRYRGIAQDQFTNLIGQAHPELFRLPQSLANWPMWRRHDAMTPATCWLAGTSTRRCHPLPVLPHTSHVSIYMLVTIGTRIRQNPP